MSTPVFRFAPSPNGYLHLGHACSALVNARMAEAAGGRLLLRIEDIDEGFEEVLRSLPTQGELEDLLPLGFVQVSLPPREADT